MKFNYQISELALEDLDSIWIYTAQNWSTVQANKYFKSIFSQIDLLCTNPEIGRVLSNVKLSHRSILIKSHLIFYKIENKTIFIDRILHKRMDFENSLE